MYKALVFDFDDTLVNSNKIKRKTFLDILGEMGFNEKEICEVTNDERKSRVEVFNFFLSDFNETEIDMKIEAFSKRVFEDISRLSPSKDFFSIVNFAKEKNIYLFLSSNTPEEELVKILNRMNISFLFKEIHGYPKQKAETLKKIVKQYQLDPNSVLVIGDGDSDRDAAALNQTDFFRVTNNSLSPLIPFLNGK